MSEENNPWYYALRKPSFQPPGWVFGPVWTILYTLMGVSFFIILRSSGENKIRALVIFGIQLILNFLWTYLFFNVNNLRYSLIDILILDFFVIWNIIEFYKINKTARMLLVPYILWLSVATTLNISLITLNPGVK